MKIEYVRNMQFGYMKITMAEAMNDLEEKMLELNCLESILPIHWQKENNNYILHYDITGKQALDALLENTLADEKLLKNLLVGICVAVKQLENFLLKQESLLLLPEAIFWDYKMQTMHFAYCPESTKSLQQQLVELLEYLLAKTDHKNVLAVQMVYGVYEEIQKPYFSMGDLQIYIQKISKKENESMEGQEQKMPDEISEDSQVAEEDVYNRAVRETLFQAGIKPIILWVKKRILKGVKINKKESIIFHMKEEPEQEAVTTLLNPDCSMPRGILKYEGSNCLPDIMITKLPFIIGSSCNCDGVVEHPNISRFHAKITCREGVYYIEDLNSTNGTKVNEGLLSYKTQTIIRKNERIYLANEPYCFL